MNDELLEILADGEFHSGDELGSELGVSRAAVWKRIKKVEEFGLIIESVKGKGYRIEGGLDFLKPDGIQAVLSDEATGLLSELDVLSSVTSTNQLAMERALKGQSGYVCTAEQQTAGRGRRGREWVSPFAANIYCSIVWEFSGGAAALEGLSLAVGTAVMDALIQIGVQGAQLKWPNDVIYGDQKLAGILIEMVGDAAGPCLAVIGIGVNVAMPMTVGQDIDQPFTDINTILGRSACRSELFGELLNTLLPLLRDFEKVGFEAYREAWLAAHAYQNKDVFIRLGDTIEIGVVQGVDGAGSIIVETAAGLKKFSGGEVSLRPAV